MGLVPLSLERGRGAHTAARSGADGKPVGFQPLHLGFSHSRQSWWILDIPFGYNNNKANQIKKPTQTKTPHNRIFLPKLANANAAKGNEARRQWSQPTTLEREIENSTQGSQQTFLGIKQMIREWPILIKSPQDKQVSTAIYTIENLLWRWTQLLFPRPGFGFIPHSKQ